MPITPITPKTPHSIIDSDGHIVEADSAWTDFLDPRFRDFAPRPIRDGEEFYFQSGAVEGFRMRARPETLSGFSRR